MINFEDKERNKIFNGNLLKIIVTILISIMLTYVIINFIPFSDMLDDFKVTFKTSNLEQITKYFSFTIAIIVIPIYTILSFVIYAIVKFICEKISSRRNEE